MTPRNQLIAIAKACGWKNIHNALGCFSSTKLGHLVGNKDNGHTFSDIPNYMVDLNSMHQAENTLPDDKWKLYDSWLTRIVCQDLGAAKISRANTNRPLIQASASQRAEAFVRTIGKWEQDPVCIKIKRPSKPRIKQNVWGNWSGYLGVKKVVSFGNTPIASQETQANEWLFNKLEEYSKQ